ncbi:Uncharacterised protein [uncultured archaeon]|nr:Uncharacterised protein [uncultured archaeon]
MELGPSALALIQIANLLLAGYLMVAIYHIGVHSRKGPFSKALHMIFMAVSLIFVAFLLNAISPFSSDRLEAILSIGSVLFLGLLVCAIHEIRRDLLAHSHLAHRHNKHRSSYLE